MGQATVDLPDPLQNTGESAAPTKSADDLLSQMASDEIDRLLAENDAEPAAQTPPPSAEVPPVATAPTPAAVPAEPSIGTVNLDAVLETAAADRTTEAEKAALHAPVAPTIEPDNSPQIELGESLSRLPLILRPLEWLSAPLDPWPDQLREILGKIGLVTLINALAVLAYVLLFRKHH